MSDLMKHPSAEEPLIIGRNLTKHYRRGSETVRALDGVDLSVATGEMVAVVGPSGSGKTTLVNTLACLDAPTEGSLIINGVDTRGLTEDALVTIRRGFFGFVFQKFYLLPTLSVAENVELPLLFLRRNPSRRTTLALLETLEIASRADHLPRELSGGQMQRVAIARALIVKPRVLIADEPTGNLDSTTSDSIFDLFEDLSHRGLSIIVTTHNLPLAHRASRVVTLQDGKIVKEELLGR
jgi:putative ABC transport system ATP-binding protein